MSTARTYSSDIAFTPAVKAIQAGKGSRDAYARMEAAGSWKTRITPDLVAFIAAQTSIFFATANNEGQPYIQHRGGPPGFLRVIDDSTLGFADFTGNRQYITTGNLADNPKAYLFLIDYAQRRRIKIWGEARVVADDAGLTAKLMPENYKARPEQAILFTVSAAALRGRRRRRPARRSRQADPCPRSRGPRVAPSHALILAGQSYRPPRLLLRGGTPTSVPFTQRAGSWLEKRIV